MRTLSDALEQTAGLQYLNITLDGLRPRVEWRRLWPKGQEQVARFQRVVEAARTTAGQVDDLTHDLPLVRANLEDMDASLKQYGRQTAQAMWYGRLLMWLVAAIIASHGGHHLLGVWRNGALDERPS